MLFLFFPVSFFPILFFLLLFFYQSVTFFLLPIFLLLFYLLKIVTSFPVSLSPSTLLTISCYLFSCDLFPTQNCYLSAVTFFPVHYSNATISVMVSQITSLMIVYSGADQRKHQSSASLAFVRGIHRWPVNSLHKGPVTQKRIPFDDVIM